jgi:hypothetical protein
MRSLVGIVNIFKSMECLVCGVIKDITGKMLLMDIVVIGKGDVE